MEVAAFSDERRVRIGDGPDKHTPGFVPTDEYAGRIGWKPGPDARFGNPDHPWNVAWRKHHQVNSGIKGLELHNAQEEGFEVAAAADFHRDGFCVVTNALVGQDLVRMQAASDAVVREMMALDPMHVGNRGSHRYSFGPGGSFTGHQMHRIEWAQLLVDNEACRKVMTEIWGSRDYVCKGGGGDFVLPGCPNIQPLHEDMGNALRDPSGRMTHRDLPPPACTCNFLMCDVNWENGPIRQIPGTQYTPLPKPSPAEEPEWMKLSTVCPAPAGAVVMRDVRAWHGGTPNLSNEVRAMPNAEFLAPWYNERMPLSMPRAIFDTLSDHGKDTCRRIVADGDIAPACIDWGWSKAQQTLEKWVAEPRSPLEFDNVPELPVNRAPAPESKL